MRTFASQLKFWGFITLFVFIAIYAYIQMKDIWQGVNITVDTLEAYTVVDTSTLTLSGSAKHATRLTVNDRRIFIDEEGRFADRLLVLPGYSILTIRAEDKFGNVRVKTFELYNTEPKTTFAPLEEEAPPPAEEETPPLESDIIQ